jgi:hypothetical protein
MNRKTQIVLMTLCMALLFAWGGLGTAQAADVYAQWDFNDTLNSSAPGGQAGTADATLEEFIYTDATIGGQPARVAQVTTGDSNRYVRLPFNFNPNGGQTDHLGRFTIICDLKMPDSSSSIQPLQPSISTLVMAWVYDDYIYDYGYMSGWVQGPEKLNVGDWNRVVMTVDKTQATGGIRYYFNGGLAGSCNGTNETEASSLLSTTGAEIGSSLYGDYISNQQFNSVQFVPYTLSAAQVAALGSPTAAGIPAPPAALPLVPTPFIGPPSVLSTVTGPVDFPVIYDPGVPDVTTVNLTLAKVSLVASEGSVTGTVEILNGASLNPTITVKDITGFGKLRVFILPGTASNSTGSAGSAGPSQAVNVYPPLPDPTPPTAPATGSKLWWDASNINGPGNVGLNNDDPITLWKDRSGNANDGTPSGAGATYTASVAGFNNKPAVTFHADDANERYNFATSITDVRTVFWAIQKGDTGLHYILGCNTWGSGYGWHGGDIGDVGDGEQIWHRDYAMAEIQNGVTRVLGEPVNGAYTSMYPLGHTIISLEAAGDCTADFFSGDGRNNYNERSWMGDLAELIIYNRVLTADERNTTGRYLAGKYAKSTVFGYPDVPVVTLVYPAATVPAAVNSPVALKATGVAGSGSSIATMEFYVDWQLVGTDTTPNAAGEFVFTWTAPGTAGSHEVFARALDSRAPALAAMSAVQTIAVVNPLFVTPTGAGTKDGSSWANAMTLDNALTAADAAPSEAALIYIKTGTYTRAASYTFTKGAVLYGGFAGTETLPAQRTGTPGVDNVTTLDAGGSVEGILDNDGWNVILDRLTFTRSADTAVRLTGGTNTVNDCTFTNNAAVGPGGGIYVTDSNTVANVTRCVFKNNTAGVDRAGPDDSGEWGGAIALNNNASFHLTVDSCWFEANQAIGPDPADAYGGAICAWYADSVFITNSVFVGNASRLGGGAIELDGAPGGIFNNTFYNNQSTGTAFPCILQNWNGVTIVVNNIFSTHTGSVVAAENDTVPANVEVRNNLLFNSTVDSARVTESGTVTGNPLFVNTTTDFSLQAGSPAIKKGLSGTIGGYDVPTMDYAGRTRSAPPDLGAYEIPVVGRITVTPDPLSFGVVAKETTSTKTLTLANTGGNTPLTISAITLTGDAQFSLVDPPALPVILAGGEWLDIVVAFAAPVVTTRVPYEGTVAVANTGTVTPATGSLKAIAAPSLFPGEQPTVVVERSAGTPATTKVFPIEFNITFSEGVAGFELGDIDWAAGDVKIGNITEVTLIPREDTGAQYTVRITAITGASGTINPVVPATVCETIGKYANLLSNTDAIVTFDATLFGAVITTTASDITDATAVTCTVTFNAAVKAGDARGLIESKLGLAGTGTGASITSVLEANPSTAYTVTITTGGNGTLALTLTDDDTIMKASTNAPLNGANAGGSEPIYGPMIEVDKTAPTVLSVQRAFGATRGTNAETVTFKVTFSDIVTGVDAGDFAIACTDLTADVASVATIGNTALVVCNVKAAVGPYSLSVKTAATITNRVGLGYATGTPDPNEDYFILTQAPQTSVETWSWTLY